MSEYLICTLKIKTDIGLQELHKIVECLEFDYNVNYTFCRAIGEMVGDEELVLVSAELTQK